MKTLTADRELGAPMSRLSGPAADRQVGGCVPRGSHVLLAAHVSHVDGELPSSAAGFERGPEVDESVSRLGVNVTVEWCEEHLALP